MHDRPTPRPRRLAGGLLVAVALLLATVPGTAAANPRRGEHRVVVCKERPGAEPGSGPDRTAGGEGPREEGCCGRG